MTSTPTNEPCPKCNASSKCVHWETVHNGVGFEYYDHMYECPTHGTWAFAFRDFRCCDHDECKADPVMAQLCERAKPVAVFQDDDRPAPYWFREAQWAMVTGSGDK